MTQRVCVVDLGSSDIKAALVDRCGNIFASSTRPAPAVSGKDGHFDPDAYAAQAQKAIGSLVEENGEVAREVVGISLSSQRSTMVFVQEGTGGSASAISWQGSACGEAADQFYNEFGRDRFHRLTGMPPSPVYSVAKLAHRTSPFTSLHGHVVETLGGDGSLIDHSMASASGLYDISNGRWSNEILDHLGLDETSMDTIVPAGTGAGELSAAAARDTGLPAGTPLFVGGGDQQCAALGATGASPGRCVLSLGTAAAAMTVSDHLPDERSGGLLMMAGVCEGSWQIEGFMNAYGSCAAWWRDIVGLDSVAELENLAGEATGRDVLFLPFLAGIGTPDQRPEVRGGFVGLDSGTGRADLAMGVLTGLACETRRLVDELARFVTMDGVQAVGGGIGGAVMSRLLADVLGVPMIVSESGDAASRGAAALAWSGVLGGADPREVFGGLAGEELPVSNESGAMADRYGRYCDAVRAMMGFYLGKSS